MSGVQSRSKTQGAAGGRRSLRDRKVAQRMAVVDESERKQAAQARLDALENDHDAGDAFGVDEEDDEFQLEEEEEDDEVGANGKRVKKRGKGAAKRKLRVSLLDRRGPKTLARLLEETELDRLPASTPTYLTAAAAPGRTASVRKFCTVCGNMSTYTCVRCGSRYCCRKCYNLHTETRCLKFIG